MIQLVDALLVAGPSNGGGLRIEVYNQEGDPEGTRFSNTDERVAEW